MQTQRPFQIILLSVFGFLAVIGLVLFATFKGFGTSVKPLGAVTIWGTLPEEVLQVQLSELRRDHQEYATVSYVEKSISNFDGEVADAIASGNGPDLLLISQEQLAQEENKLSPIPLSTISERTFKDSFLPVSEIYLTSAGSYGIPFAIDPLVMYYNRSILSASGVAEPPQTWEAVMGLAPRIVQQTNGQTITRSLVSFGSYENGGNSRAILSLLLLQAGAAITSRDAGGGVYSTLSKQTDGNFGTSGSESAIRFYTEFSNPAKTVYSWNRSLPDARQAFLSGDLALYFGYASERNSLKAANPNLDFDMSVVPQPSTAATRTTYGRVYAFVIPKTARNATGAYRVASGLTGKAIAPGVARALGMAPALRSALTPSLDDLYEPVFYPEVLVAKVWLSPAPPQTDSVFAAMIGNITSGRQQVHEALLSASESIDAALH
ncbi:MAG: hypothetical protein JWN64_316 [Parcubacteria group bacterium]|nr:hypothetical protein [Parcubacteria group bacterium]